MSTRFNPKIFLNGKRIQTPVQNGISKCWTWDDDLSEYVCKSYEARKTSLIDGKLSRLKLHFDSLGEARKWLTSDLKPQIKTSLSFKELLQLWLENEVGHTSKTTQIYYQNRIGLFSYFSNFHVEHITPQVVDQWLMRIKQTNTNPQRQSFEKELRILGQIFKYHALNNWGYLSPVNTNHFKKVVVKSVAPKDKDFLENDFKKFRDLLLKHKNGLALATLATVQYYHALRIGEAAGLHWEDVRFDSDYTKRTIKIVRSVKWERIKDGKTYIEENFKNSKFLVDHKKEFILQPEAYDFLMRFKKVSDGTGLIFHKDDKPITYRYIQANYNKALRDAQLPFTSTHVLRHGGTRNELEQHGDLTLSQQRLGNSSMETTKIYAQRNKKALDSFTIAKYKKLEEKELEP